MPLCPECHNNNPTEFRFCGKCGTKLTRACPKCQFQNPLGVQFCGQCGLTLMSDPSELTFIDEMENNGSPEVIVVDDEHYLTNLLKHLLEAEGVHVRTAGKVEEALDLIEDKMPSLIITDLMMPDLDGYELIRRIRNNPNTRKIKIIMLTVIDAFEEIRKSVLLGADEYICKPFDPQELLWATKRLLGKFHAWEGRKEPAT